MGCNSLERYKYTYCLNYLQIHIIPWTNIVKQPFPQKIDKWYNSVPLLKKKKKESTKLQQKQLFFRRH